MRKACAATEALRLAAKIKIGEAKTVDKCSVKDCPIRSVKVERDHTGDINVTFAAASIYDRCPKIPSSSRIDVTWHTT